MADMFFGNLPVWFMENAGNVKAAEDIWLVLKTDDPWSASRIALKAWAKQDSHKIG